MRMDMRSAVSQGGTRRKSANRDGNGYWLYHAFSCLGVVRGVRHRAGVQRIGW